ncbi:MAG: hypothetical protein CMK59_10250 [Proteobacteria bacterium]|nr:hypothetical protein [Pseudomonadota bacterium]
MNQEIVALIPVREGSQRVKGKNYIDFSQGKSLLDVKIEQLKSADCFDHIYISSDNERTQRIATEQGVEFLLRDSEACGADMPWSEVVCSIMNTIPRDPIVVWALTTSPLFKGFNKAVDAFVRCGKANDSLVAVLPKKSFFLNKYGRGINYNPGCWHPYSQQLETLYEVTGACFIGKKSDMLKWRYWFGVSPILFEVDQYESIDVDTPSDFEFAKKLYEGLSDG